MTTRRADNGKGSGSSKGNGKDSGSSKGNGRGRKRVFRQVLR